MKVEAVFFAQVRELVGEKQKALALHEGATIRDLVDAIVREHGEPFRREIETLEGLRILVNGRDYFPDEAMDIRLKDGDCVVFLPPIFGG